jgi:hypothetical protein
VISILKTDEEIFADKFIDFNLHVEIFIKEFNQSEKKKELNNNEIALIQK